MNLAGCRGVDQDIFFGKEYHGEQRHRPSLTSIEIRRAKAICAVCPVLWDCFSYAMANEEEYGVWGGTTRRERQRLRTQTTSRRTTFSKAALEAH
jgi:WhiB family transcriptional regulator, redox-sensing transcriptional regulator